jgi:RNA polymerase primary sigma factor
MKALGALQDREREIVLLRFGFVDGETWTYLKIAERYDVTAERIRQIERAALSKLSSPHGNFSALIGFLPSQAG